MIEKQTTPSGKTMELEGNLGAFRLNDILQFLTLGRMTGTLSLNDDGRIVNLSIKEGCLVGTTSPDRQLRVGHHLVYTGQITRKDLEETLAAQRVTGQGKMLGELLVERKLVNEQQLARVLELQLKEQLWELFSWTEGSFKFEHGVTVEMERNRVSLEITPLIEEGERRLQEWKQIAQNLGDPHQAFKVRDDIHGVPDIQLNPNAWRVLSFVNGRHTIESLGCLSGLGKFDTICAIDQLLNMELIEPITARRKSGSDRPRKNIELAPGVTMSAPETPPPDDEKPRSTTSPKRSLFGFGWRSGNVADEGSATGDPPAMTENSVEERDYYTAADFGCDALNAVMAALAPIALGRSEHSSSDRYEDLWNDTSLRYPYSDLLRFRNGRLDCNAFDGWVERAGGLEEFLGGCHDDSMESLRAFGRALIEQSGESMIEQARQIAEQAVKPLAEGARIQHPVDFSARNWIERWLRRQA